MIALVVQLASLQAALLVTLPTLGGRGHAATCGGAVAEGEARPGPPPPHHLSRHAGERVINGLFLASCWYQSWLPRQKVTPRLNTRAKLQTLSVELCVSSLQKPLIDFHIIIMFSIYQQFYSSYFSCPSPNTYRASSSIFAVVQTIVIRPRGWDQKQNKQKLVKSLTIITGLVFTVYIHVKASDHFSARCVQGICSPLALGTSGEADCLLATDDHHPGSGARRADNTRCGPVTPWPTGPVMHHTDVTTCSNLVTTYPQKLMG